MTDTITVNVTEQVIDVSVFPPGVYVEVADPAKVGPRGFTGADGKSAYQVAVDNGFVGTEAEWLVSIVGPAGSTGAQGPQGDAGVAGQDGINGQDGKSAYQVAVDQGFIGTELEWLASLIGPSGNDGQQGVQGDVGPQGPQGDTGSTGASAYEVAVNQGFVGTEQQWLDSLVGPQGPQGIQGPQGAAGTNGTNGSNGLNADMTRTSTDSVTIGTGSKTLTYPSSSNLGWVVGTRLRATKSTDPTVWMEGPASAVSGTSVTITVDKTSGSGTVTSWNIGIAGEIGATGPAGGNGVFALSGKTGAYTVVSGDLGAVINCTANTFTVSLTAAATLGTGFWCWVWNTSNTVSHVITIDPNSTETIDGATTLILRRGEGVQIVCDGTNWQTGGLKKYRLYSENAANNATRAAVTGSNAVGIGNAAVVSGTSAVGIGDGATASGISSIVIGTGRATTQDSVAIAITDNTTTYGASTSTNAIAIGHLATASGLSSVAIGDTALSSGSYAAVLGGASNTSSGSNAVVIGGFSSTATATSAVVIGGARGVSNATGKVVFPASSSIAFGVTQSGLLTIYANSTDATPTVFTATGGAVVAVNQLPLVNNQSIAFRGRCVAQRKGSESTTSTAAWEFSGVIRRGATAASTALVSAVTPTLIAADSDASTWTLAVTADTVNGALAVTGTGQAAKNIRWVCTLETTEVIYA